MPEEPQEIMNPEDPLYQSKVSLYSLLTAKDSAEEAQVCLEGLLKWVEERMQREPENTGLRAQQQMFQYALEYIAEYPVAWKADMGRTISRWRPISTQRVTETTRIYKSFEGDTVKERVNLHGQQVRQVVSEDGTVRRFVKDSKGEWMPADTSKEHGQETTELLSLMQEGKVDEIEKLGYKIKRYGDRKD